MRIKFTLYIFLLIFLSACSGSTPIPSQVTPQRVTETPTVTATSRQSETALVVTVPPSVIATPTVAPSSQPTLSPVPPVQPSGPDEYPPGVNPLTGLPAADPKLLQLPPALISVPNSPISARPQMGLSSAAWVFEFWIGEGVTRFLPVFYGELPTQGINNQEPAIGPVRSGRLFYEPLRKMFGGFLMMTYASPVVMQELSNFTDVINESQPKSISGAKVDVAEVLKLAGEYRKQIGEPHINGQRFDPQPPLGGKTANTIWMPWSWLSQVWWRYDPQQGVYHRWQDQEDGKTFVQATDRLTQKPLGFENVVVLFAEHTAYCPVLISVDFNYIKKSPALVFRDGKIYPVFWTTSADSYERTTGRLRPMRFIDGQGNPFPLKPGHTWVAIMTPGSPYYETVDSQDYTWMATKTAPGSGIWAVRFAVPEPLVDGK